MPQYLAPASQTRGQKRKPAELENGNGKRHEGDTPSGMGSVSSSNEQYWVVQWSVFPSSLYLISPFLQEVAAIQEEQNLGWRWGSCQKRSFV